MGPAPPIDAPCAKGWLPYALEECSRSADARAIFEKLQDAMLTELAPDYDNLTEIFDRHLLAHVVPAAHRAKVAQHLERHWFGRDRSEALFPEQDVAAIYAQGVLNTLELALRSATPARITSWWIVDAPAVKLLTFGEVDRTGAADGGVSLLIMTPRPRDSANLSRTYILREEAEVWVAEESHGQVVSRMLETGWRKIQAA
jgi:hypothetical protein